jgi:glycerol-3-phosphate dehydrogenase (NAD(P)+)
MAKIVAVLGAGNMGTSLAQVLARNGHRVHIWSLEGQVLAEIQTHRLNRKYLGNILLHPTVEAKPRLAEALEGAVIAVLAVPSRAIRSLAKEVAPHLSSQDVMVLNVAKGLEVNTNLRMSQVLAQVLPDQAIATMGGPAIAVELARGKPTALAVAAAQLSLAEEIRRLLENDFLKVESTTDLCGVEMGAALKNVYAIALGVCDGLGLQDRTLWTVAGLGDFLTTGYSPHSRNRTLGEKLVADASWRRYLETHTVEGVPACRAVHQLLGPQGIEAPLLEVMHGVLHEGLAPEKSLRQFLTGFRFPTPRASPGSPRTP